MRKLNVFIVLSVILVSGCVGGGNNSGESKSASVQCSQMQLEILDGSGEDVRLMNIGDSSFGNVTITWEYSSGSDAVIEVPTPDVMERKTFESNDSGVIDHISVQHNVCPSRRASFY